MYLGNIKNLSDTRLSDETLEKLSEYNFIEKYFESKFNFNSIKLKDNDISTSLKDLHYLEKMGFYRVQKSHLYNSFFSLISGDYIKPYHKFDELTEIQKKFHSPDIVFNRLKDNFIEEIAFYKSHIANDDILKIATKAKYHKSGKFFRDNSNSGFIFPKYKRYDFNPYGYFKFNKNDVTFNFYTNSKNKNDKKISFKLPFMDGFIEQSKFLNYDERKKTENLIFSFFEKKIKLTNVIKNFEHLKTIKINSKTDLLTILSDDEIELLKIIVF